MSGDLLHYTGLVKTTWQQARKSAPNGLLGYVAGMNVWQHRLTLCLLGALVLLTGLFPAVVTADGRVQHVLSQADEFRSRQPATGNWETDTGERIIFNRDATPHSDLFEVLVTPNDADSLTALIRCLLVCDELAAGFEQIDGVSWSDEPMTLGFDDEGALFYTIGATDVRGGVSLEIQRDTYQLRAVNWVASSGREVRIAFASYQPPGWQPVALRVFSGNKAVELTFDPSAKRAQKRHGVEDRGQ